MGSRRIVLGNTDSALGPTLQPRCAFLQHASCSRCNNYRNFNAALGKATPVRHHLLFCTYKAPLEDLLV